MERLQHAARLVAGLAVALGLAAQVTAGDAWWNPFDNASNDTEQRRSVSATSDGAKSKIGFPTLPMPSLPKWNLSGSNTGRKPAPKGPSTLDKLNSGTKAFFSKTADLLTPWDNDPAPPTRSRSVTGSRKVSSSNSSRKSEDKGMFSWFSKEDEEPEIKTANDFLKLPRPY